GLLLLGLAPFETGERFSSLTIDGDLQRLEFLIAPDFHINFASRLHAGHKPRKIAHLADLLTIKTEDNVAGPNSSVFSWAARLYAGHQRTLSFLQPEAFSQLGRHLLDLNSQPSTLNFTAIAKLLDDVAGKIGGNGKADTDRTPGW